jgi:predicted component of type VI protein secretion system
MKPLQPIFWHQGLFLQPQHFQQYDLFNAASADALYRELSGLKLV